MATPGHRFRLLSGSKRGFGLQAEVFHFRAFGSDGGLEPTATPDPT